MLFIHGDAVRSIKEQFLSLLVIGIYTILQNRVTVVLAYLGSASVADPDIFFVVGSDSQWLLKSVYGSYEGEVAAGSNFTRSPRRVSRKATNARITIRTARIISLPLYLSNLHRLFAFA